MVLPAGAESIAQRRDPVPLSCKVVTCVEIGGSCKLSQPAKPAVASRSSTMVSTMLANWIRLCLLARKKANSFLFGVLRLAQACASTSCDPRYRRSFFSPRSCQLVASSLMVCCSRISSRASCSQLAKRGHSRIKASWLTSNTAVPATVVVVTRRALIKASLTSSRRTVSLGSKSSSSSGLHGVVLCPVQWFLAQSGARTGSVPTHGAPQTAGKRRSTSACLTRAPLTPPISS